MLFAAQWPLRLAIFGLLHAGLSLALIDIICADTDVRQQVNSALDDAVMLAQNIKTQLETNFARTYVREHFFQLFPEDQKDTVLLYYSRVAGDDENPDIRTDPRIRVRMYCTEDHVHWSDELRSWVDKDYTFPFWEVNSANPNGGLLVTRNIDYNLRSYNQAEKPGASSSYTTLGYFISVEGENGQHGYYADTLNQAHVFLSSYRLNPPAADYDSRAIQTIRDNGLDTNFNVIDKIHPLSVTVLHELMHVVGGLRDSAGRVGDAIINDGPGLDVYGLEKCFQGNVNFQTHASSVSPTTFADSYAVLAKEVYLQIRKTASGADYNGQTIWITSKVDPETLQPLPVG